MPECEEKTVCMAGFEEALPALRPELHRYCARMTGSVIDGEDILQEALIKAMQALTSGAQVEHLRAWLFRIAHTTALNHFRAEKGELAMKENILPLAESQQNALLQQAPTHNDTADNLRPFLALPPRQRSSVILRDVLGYSAKEVAECTDSTIASVKSALHRGRSQLKEAALTASSQEETEMLSGKLSGEDQEKLSLYAKFFNAHDFDSLRDMLSEEVKLDLVNMVKQEGKAKVSGYYGNYSKASDWLMAPGLVESQPALLVFDRDDASQPPLYFILIDFTSEGLISIRDFRYARYAIEDARWQRM
ncbi:sigma-70 family RNA polymerase sigma factor [Kiloniella sp.]|uniref:sigma-70 family RNA polymerase sigma factor n=1 Tax=Kiloniella sp. TaxID=1938587 RepID=UPI003B01BB63